MTKGKKKRLDTRNALLLVTRVLRNDFVTRDSICLMLIELGE